MTVSVFYNPDLVGQLATCGITARRPQAPGARAQGFVVEGRRSQARARDAVTNVIDVRGHVTITGRRPPTERAALPAPAATSASEPQTALELIEECGRLRRDNQRLSDEVARLRGQVERLTAGPSATTRESVDLDDSTRRFALLELD